MTSPKSPSSHRPQNTASNVPPVAENQRKFSFEILRHGIKKRCPNCGIGPVLTGYLKPLPESSACGEDFRHISADDGPAWLTLILVGHAIVPLMLYFGRDEQVSLWLAFLILSIVTLAGVYVILPRAKGVFIGLIWATGATGAAMTRDDRETPDA